MVYGFLASLVWEFGHSVLYLDHARDLAYIIWTRVHCSLGDVLILLGAFWWTALWFRTRFWFERNTLLPTTLFVLSGPGLHRLERMAQHAHRSNLGLHSLEANALRHRSQPARTMADHSCVTRPANETTKKLSTLERSSDTTR